MPPNRPSSPQPEPSWSGWGDPGHAVPLPPRLLHLLQRGLGVRPRAQRPATFAEVPLPPVRVPLPTEEALAAIVGPAHVRSDPESRLRHLRGKSTTDLLRLRARDAASAPDLVLTPASHDEIVQILRLCTERATAVVPYGGGTSVVGGLEPQAQSFAGVVALDVGRLNALKDIDEESRLAIVEAGLRAPAAEQLLSERGYTLGHFPQSFEYATLGGFAATRSSGQASAGYGRFDDLVQALTLATPKGTLHTGRAPKSAAGPDLRQLMLGSEGTLGVITELTLAVRPSPRLRVYDGWRFPSFAEGIKVVRRLAQDGPLPTVIRLSDEAETALTSAENDYDDDQAAGALAIVGFEGNPADVSARVAAVKWALEGAGAERDRGAGPDWARDRFKGPYLRDALLDAGALVETLETVTYWSRLTPLYQAVCAALQEALTAQGTPPVVLCHISHVYASGASLYFTVACAQTDDPLAQWRAAKRAASEAILDHGGSISHHHGIGTEHREWYVREIGQLGAAALTGLKATLDPAGILNPGILLPRGPEISSTA